MFLTRAHLVGRRLTMRPTDHLPKTCKKYDLSIDARTRLTDCLGWETSRDSGGSGGPRWPVETGDLFLPMASPTTKKKRVPGSSHTGPDASLVLARRVTFPNNKKLTECKVVSYWVRPGHSQQTIPAFSSSPPRAWITSAEAQRLMVPDRCPVQQHQQRSRRVGSALVAGMLFPPALLEHTGVSRQQQAMWKYVQDKTRMSFPINPPSFIWRISERKLAQHRQQAEYLCNTSICRP